MKKRLEQPCFLARVETTSGARRGALYIYDIIGWLGISARSVVRALEQFEADGVTGLDVYINSPGGDAYDSVAIYSAIMRWGRGSKIVTIDGLAASGASIIAMAGDVIRISEGGMMMVHSPWTIADGNAAALRKEADRLDAIRDSIIGIYLRVTGAERATLEAMLEAETWMAAREAIDLRFAHELAQPDQARTAVPADLLDRPSNLDFPLFNRLPEAAQAAFRQPHPRGGAPVAEEDDMDEKQRRVLAAALGLPTDASVDQIMAAVDRMSRMARCLVAVSTQLGLQPDAIEQQVVGAVIQLQNPADRVSSTEMSALRSELETLRSAARKRDARDAVARAQDLRKVGGEEHPQYAWALSYAEKDPEGFAAWLASAPELYGSRVQPRTEEQRKQTATGAAPMTARQRKIAKSLGVTDEEFEKFGRAPVDEDDDDEADDDGEEG